MLLSEVPSTMQAGPISLQLDKIVTVKPGGELVPYYHFKIVDNKNVIVGHINFRVGDTRHITLCAGHIGFEILPQYRGRSFSYYACQAISPLVKKHYDYVIITVDPTNVASTKIIEKLGASFINEIDVPVDDPAYAGRARLKKRYKWIP